MDIYIYIKYYNSTAIFQQTSKVNQIKSLVQGKGNLFAVVGLCGPKDTQALQATASLC